MNREAQAQYRRNRNTKVREQIINLLGGKCASCRYNIDVRALCIDHKNGGGTRERNQRGGDHRFYILKKILQGSTEYQILCANCNQIKKEILKEHGKIKQILAQQS